MPRTVVVGAGVAGLVAGRAAAAKGHEVTILESSERLGGQVWTRHWRGLPIDAGAEALFLGAPHARDLVTDLGLLPHLVGPNPGTSWLHTPRGLTLLPEGVGPTGPTRFKPVLKSGLLSPLALVRAGLEPLLARTKITDDISVGDFITRRFGAAVTRTFVDPMLGNLHAGDVNRLSLRSTAAQLVPAAREGRSLLLRKAPPPRPSNGPLFASLPDGLSGFVDALADGLDVRLGHGCREVRRTRDGWQVSTDTTTLDADTVILAVPAGVATTLLASSFPDIVDPLARGRVADVATVVLAYPREAGRLPALAGANGLLLRSGSGRLLKAVTFLSRKWTHLDDGEQVLVRTSAGRVGYDALNFIGDDALVSRIHQELADLVGLETPLLDSLVTRWAGAYPQLEVGHAARMESVRATLAGSGIQLAGAPYDGLGLPSVIKSGFAAAAALG